MPTSTFYYSNGSSTTSSDTIINSSSYSNDRTIVTANLGDGVLGISNSAFFNCSLLTSVSIPNSVSSIGTAAFRFCTSLPTIIIPSSIQGLAREIFSDCTSLNSITIPDSVTAIGYSAFYRCLSLQNFTISNYVTYIDEGAFSTCGLTTINVPDNVTNLGAAAFYNCASLTSVIIGNGVFAINGDTFNDCRNLTNITIGSNVQSISATRVFQNCDKLASIVVSPSNLYFSNDSSGVLFNKNKTFIVRYPFGRVGPYTIPDSVTTLEERGVAGAYGAFRFCTGLTSLIIHNGISAIPSNTFASCRNIKNITIGNNVQSIGTTAFFNCQQLTSITIPSSVTSILGGLNFSQCYKLNIVKFDGNLPTINSDPFNQNAPDLKIYRENLAIGWTSTLYEKPVFISSSNIIKSGGSGKLTTKKRYLYIATGIGLSPNINGLRFYLSGINALGHLSFRDETNTYELYYTPFGSQFAIRPLPFSIATPPSTGWTKGSSSNPTDPPTGNYTQSAGGYAGVVTISEYFR